MTVTTRAAGESKMRHAALIPSYASMLILMALLRWFGVDRAGVVQYLSRSGSPL